MNTNPQPDLLAGAGPKTIEKPRPARTKAAAKPAPAKKDTKTTGKAVAVHDPKKEVSAQQQQQPSNFLAVIMQAATNPACDVGKMQALLDMQRQLEERDAKKAFTRDFIAMQKELPTISRDGKIEVHAKTASGERNGKLQQSTPYATYPAIMDVCKPIMDRHGFTLASWIEPEAGGQRIVVISQLDHVEHHSRTSRFPLPAETSGSKNNVQGWGSSQQYGMRYNAIALLNITSRNPKDADTDGHEGSFVKSKDGLAEAVETETISDEQLSELNSKMVAFKVPLAVVLKHYAIEKLEHLPAKLFPAAMKNCETYTPAKPKDDTFPADRVSTGGPGGTYRR